MPLKNTLWSLDTGKMKAETAQSGDCMNRDERTTHEGPAGGLHSLPLVGCPSKVTWDFVSSPQ